MKKKQDDKRNYNRREKPEFNLLKGFRFRRITRFLFGWIRKKRSTGIALMIGKDKIARAFIVSLGDSFNVKNKTYAISNECIYTINKVPFMIYQEGNFDPVNVNSEDRRTVNASVMKDLFRKSKMTGAGLNDNLTMLLLLVCACGIGLLVVLALNGKLLIT